MAAKKNILVFIDWFTPGYKAGGPIQSCSNMVRLLSDQYNFNIITSDRDLGETESYPGITINTWVPVENVGNVYYASPGKLNTAQVIKLVKEIDPAIVYFNSMFSPRYTLQPLWALRYMGYVGKVVIAPRGMLHEGAMMRKSLKKNLFIRVFRLSGWPKKLVFHATDEQENKDIFHYFPSAKAVHVISNIPQMDEQPVLIPSKQRGELKMVFISRIHPKKNLAFILEALAKTYQGKILFDIYGEADDIKYDQQCKSLAAQLPSAVQVRFKGPVSHKDVFETLYQYHLFVLPTLGENFGHAIFESLSAGRPVLISDKTPWRLLAKSHAGWDLPLSAANKYQAVIQQTLDMEQSEFSKWVTGARQFSTQFVNGSDFRGNYSALFQ